MHREALSGVSFNLTEEQQMLQQTARDFSRKEIAPVAEHYDRTAEFPWDVFRKAQSLGLTTLNIPEEYGGFGASVFEECLVGEELAWGCSGMSTALTINNLASLPITLGGTDEQKKEWLGRLVDGQLAAYGVTEPGAGSDVVGLRTRAELRGDVYVLNGSKTFISNANVADFFTVFAVTDPNAGHKGLSCFVVERKSPGVSVSKHFDKLGQRCADTAEITFEDVEVPAANLLGGKPGMGFYLAMKVFDHSRPPVAAGAVGVAQRALDESVRYAKERETFGVPIYQHQAIGHMIADMAMGVEAARLLTWRAATMVDEVGNNTKYASFAKAFAADTAMKITVDAVQVFGGYGFMKEYPVEKLMRDVKVFQIYEGTSQIQRNVIVRELFRG
ncbi:MAG: acyl-CoA dehydrogenase family protein [Anaerolineales bacterium]|nr:acyl-CoA dehydrogenase family protein [Anaerolineales bacterium]